MALQVSQSAKPIKKMKPKPRPVKPQLVKKLPAPKPVKKIIPKKTMLTTAKPEIKKIPQSKAMQLEKVPEKILEQMPKEIPKETIVQQHTAPVLPMLVPIFKLTESPQFLHKEALVYPEAMRSSGVTGIVKLAVLIAAVLNTIDNYY